MFIIEMFEHITFFNPFKVDILHEIYAGVEGVTWFNRIRENCIIGPCGWL